MHTHTPDLPAQKPHSAALNSQLPWEEDLGLPRFPLPKTLARNISVSSSSHRHRGVAGRREEGLLNPAAQHLSSPLGGKNTPHPNLALKPHPHSSGLRLLQSHTPNSHLSTKQGMGPEPAPREGAKLSHFLLSSFRNQDWPLNLYFLKSFFPPFFLLKKKKSNYSTNSQQGSVWSKNSQS